MPTKVSAGCKTCGGTGKVVESGPGLELLAFGHPDADLDSEVWLCPDCWWLDQPGGES